MRKGIIWIFLTLTLSLSATPISENLVTAFQKGNSTEIAKHFGKSVDLSIPNNEGVYSSIQAKLILKTFFLKNKPSEFSVVHNGDSKNNSHYSIGNLSTSKGTYRTYILYKVENQKTTILELKIESDE